jgi:hypothetical protein
MEFASVTYSVCMCLLPKPVNPHYDPLLHKRMVKAFLLYH